MLALRHRGLGGSASCRCRLSPRHTSTCLKVASQASVPASQEPLPGSATTLVPAAASDGAPPPKSGPVTAAKTKVKSITPTKVASAEEAAFWRRMLVHFTRGEPVTVTVKTVNIKGILVTFDEPQRRGFIHANQCGALLEGGVKALLGQQIVVRVAGLKEETQSVLFRAIDPQRGLSNELPVAPFPEGAIDAFEVGQTVRGVVRDVSKHVAMVELNRSGVIGELRRGEISSEPVADARDCLTVGRRLQVQILSVDKDKQRLRLSAKRLRPLQRSTAAAAAPTKPLLAASDAGEPSAVPQQAAAASGATQQQQGVVVHGPQVGEVVSGVVVRVMQYGALVDLGTSVGLLHASRISATPVTRVGDYLVVGQQLKCLVLETDPQTRRSTLSTQPLEPSPGDMLSSPRLVFDRAEEMAARWRLAQAGLPDAKVAPRQWVEVTPVEAV